MLRWLAAHNTSGTGRTLASVAAVDRRAATGSGARWSPPLPMMQRLGQWLLAAAAIWLAAGLMFENMAVGAEAVAVEPAKPWELDEEEREELTEQFLAITDRTTEIQIEEMPAYWRLLSWVQAQSVQDLGERARTDLLLMDLYHRPASHRGELLSLDLNVCRVLAYEVSDNVLGIRKLYEVWGWTQESGTKLYVGITPELPDGFPVGASVSERATFCGYFFKLQGYLEAKAAPRSRPLAAPLLIGKMEWHPKKGPPARNAEVPWLVILAVCAFGWLSIRVLPTILGKRRRPPRTPRGEEILAADEWWQRVQQSQAESAPASGSATLSQPHDS